MLPVVTYVRGTGSLTLREDCCECSRTGLWGRYLDLSREEVTGDWTKLYNEGLH